MSCNRRYWNWRLFFPRHNANAERDCILYRCSTNKSAMVLAFGIPAGWDRSRCNQRVGSSLRAAFDVAVDIRRPRHSTRRARGLLGIPVSHCTPRQPSRILGYHCSANISDTPCPPVPCRGTPSMTIPYTSRSPAAGTQCRSAGTPVWKDSMPPATASAGAVPHRGTG